MRYVRNLIYPRFRISKRARKIMVEFDGATFRVLTDRLVKMAPPPSDPVADFQNQTGFWYSVSDDNGRILYRRVISAPLVTGAEVFTNSPDEQLYRLTEAPRTATLVLIFPDLVEATRLEIFGTRRDREGQPAPASLLTSVSLKEVDRTRGKHGRD